MADQKNRGGQKEGKNAPDGQSEQHQGVHNRPDEATELHPERPAPGQPGGPKQNEGQTRSTDG